MSGENHGQQYHISHRDEQHYLCKATSGVTQSDIRSLGDLVSEIFNYVSEHKISTAGSPFFRYRSVNSDQRWAIDVGIPVSKVDLQCHVEDAQTVKIGVLPAGKYLEKIHVGAPSELRMATKSMLGWADEQGFKWDVSTEGKEKESKQVWAGRVEWYETDPHTEPDESKWCTRLSFKLAES